jgi:aryl-alcohol dehydrogenase-like predicted oxidoreductase
MSPAYGGQPEAESIAAVGGAIKLGITLLDIAELYGPYENEVPFGTSRKSASGRLAIATKFGLKIVAKKKSGSDDGSIRDAGKREDRH